MIKIKKSVILTSLLVFILIFTSGCGGKDVYEIDVKIPAGLTETVYADEEIIPTSKTITIGLSEGTTDAQISIIPASSENKKDIETAYITKGLPLKLELEKGIPYKIGIATESGNPKDITVSIKIKGIDVRIE